MKYISSLILCLFCVKSYTKTITVAVIDTGLRSDYISKTKLCKTGHKSFVKGQAPLIDRHGHGTNVVGLITKYAENSNYCIYIIKYYDYMLDGDQYSNFYKALVYAYNLNPDIINISAGGYGAKKEEGDIIRKILNNKVTINAAAGNDHIRLAYYRKECLYYPACYYDAINVIGNKDTGSSNYGPIVDYYVNGNNMLGFGKTLSGTSQSTAIFTGKLIRQKTTSRSPNNQTRDALRAATKAMYLETGLDKKVKRIEKKYIPTYVKEHAGWMALMLSVTQEKKIKYKWKF